MEFRFFCLFCILGYIIFLRYVKWKIFSYFVSLLINEGKFILSTLVFLYLRKIYERNEKVFICIVGSVLFWSDGFVNNFCWGGNGSKSDFWSVNECWWSLGSGCADFDCSASLSRDRKDSKDKLEYYGECS